MYFLLVFCHIDPWSMIHGEQMKPVDLEHIDKWYAYNPDTGEVYRKTTYATLCTPDTHGGYIANIRGRVCSVHRIAWFLSHGEWPPFNLRHRDGNRRNNRIDNLEPVSIRHPK
jgi:hypothetical protein